MGQSTQTSGGHDMDHYADDLAALTARLNLHDATLRTYRGYPHGMPTTHADVINADLLAWLQA